MFKVTKNQGFTLSLEKCFLEKPQEGGWGGVRLTLLLSLFRVNAKYRSGRKKQPL